MTQSSDRVAIFVDSSSFNSQIQRLGLKIDYQRFSDYFETYGVVFRRNFYITLDDTNPTNSVVPLLDWLDFHGWITHRRGVRNLDTARASHNMDVAIAVDILGLSGKTDTVILATGSAAFVPLIEAVQRMGVEVIVVASKESADDELRRLADEFIDLAAISDRVRKAEVDGEKSLAKV